MTKAENKPKLIDAVITAIINQSLVTIGSDAAPGAYTHKEWKNDNWNNKISPSRELRMPESITKCMGQIVWVNHNELEG